jgi:hypothetical protein
MLRHRLPAIALALVVIALAGPSRAAGAKPFGGIFVLRATHGFKVVGLIGSKGNDTELNLFVERRHEGATYIVRGTRDGEAFDFDLGAVGKVEVEAQPTGRMETVHPKCGKPFTLEGAAFVGTIEFHGEEGFAEAQAERTPIRYDLLADMICVGSLRGETFGATERGARLRARRKDGPEIQINQNHPGAAVHYEAQITEKHGGMTINRAVVGHLGGGAFDFDPTLTDASFAPAAPFTGAATYRGVHPPRGTHVAHGTWRGNLKVDFPGHAAVPLAGPGFNAAIIHAKRTESNL